MGVLIAFVTGVAICFASQVMRRSLALYILLFFLIFFQEIGEGFTTFNGSFIFNQDFLKFYSLKFIEIVIAMVYFFVLFTNKGKRPNILRFERKLFYIFAGLIPVLCFIEFYIHGTVSVSDWRLLISGLMLFHILSMMLRTEKDILTFVKVMLIMVSIRALIGLIAYGAGYGINSPRGTVPFFWDTRQVDTFVLGIILLTSYLVSYRLLPQHGRLFSKLVAASMLMLLLLTVLLSIRRTEWMMAIGGVFFIIFLSKAAKIQHVATLMFVLFIGLTVILTLPGFENFRHRMGGYIDSMNLTSKAVSKQQDNAVHIDNVEQYVRIITEEPEILYLGYRARKGDDYQVFKGGEYGLGVAHNSIIRPIQHFGLMGAVLYLLLFVRPIMLYRQLARLPQNSATKHIAVGALVFLLMLFIPSLIFVPPFYTTIKGLFFTFLAVFLVRASLYHSLQVNITRAEKYAIE